jgi:BirA family biotin operon repressor/biotin-[acetyl-CoA-carboxylase] ligase
MVARRKLAGILAETLGVERRPVARPGTTHVVLGYGINIRSTAYPPDLRDRATSLETELGRPIDRASMCAETLAAVSRRYRDLLAGRFDAILDGWRSRAPGSRGARVTWSTPSGPGSGVTAGIDDRGALLARVGDRVETIVGGEVTWL